MTIDTFIGIDYSYTSPSICVIYQDTIQFYYITTIKKAVVNHPILNGILYKKESFTELERFDFISDWAMDIIQQHQNSIIGIEGYSYGSSGRTFQVAEACGLLKYKLWKNKITPKLIPPAAVKKFFTGSGGANKEDMYMKWEELNMPDLKSIFKMSRAENPISDIVDSYAIAKYAPTY